MKFTCTQQNLLQGLSIAEKIIGKNFALPILQNILITCKKNKGYIKKDFDADLTIVDLNRKITIDNKDMQSKCKWTPYHGETFKGCPIATIVNGKIKMKNGKIIIVNNTAS